MGSCRVAYVTVSELHATITAVVVIPYLSTAESQPRRAKRKSVTKWKTKAVLSILQNGHPHGLESLQLICPLIVRYESIPVNLFTNLIYA